MTNDDLGWAVIGTGPVSRFIATDLALVSGARRHAVCSRDKGRGEQFATEFGFARSYDSVAALLADESVDIVYIATPHITHAQLAIEALRAQKHVLIEKPMAVNAAEARQIAEVAADAGRFAMEAMWMRFNPAYRAAIAAARAGELGEVRSIRASFGLPFHEPHSTALSANKASSTLVDQGIYPVTLARDVLGDPDEIVARARVRSDGVDLSQHIAFEYNSGCFAQLAASMVEYLEPSASMSGTEGWLTIPAPFWAASTFEKRTGDIGNALMHPVQYDHGQQGFGYQPMLTAVSEAITDGLVEHPQHTLADTIDTLTLLDRIRASMTTHTPAAEETS